MVPTVNVHSGICYTQEMASDEDYSQKWDLRFLALAEHIAGWSKDRSTKVGAVIVGPHNDVRSLGYNGFPRNINDDVEERHLRPAKYKWTEHAERNAIYNAARNNTPIYDCTMYLTWYPCTDCARGIIQTGITTIVCGKRPDDSNPAFTEDFKITAQLLEEAGVMVIFPNN